MKVLPAGMSMCTTGLQRTWIPRNRSYQLELHVGAGMQTQVLWKGSALYH